MRRSDLMLWFIIYVTLSACLIVFLLMEVQRTAGSCLDARADYADAMIEIERLEARLSLCRGR